MLNIDHLESWIENLLTRSGVIESVAVYLRVCILTGLLFLAAGFSYLILKRIISVYVYKLIRKSATTWDDLLADHKVLSNLAHILPAFFIREIVPSIFRDFESVLPYAVKITDAYLIVAGMTIIFSLLRAGEFSLSSKAAFRDKPLSSYFQLIRIILYIVTGILVLSILLGKSPVYFLSAFGAMTAILLLVFKDTILGLVASVQMSTNDMVRTGDWVEMPKFNADGIVLAMNLNTVKIQNWDKTITTIPTYYFISDSFKNWRGMEESGGRRIKRAIYLNTNNITFIQPEKRELYKKYQLIKNYIEEKQNEIDLFNLHKNIDTSVLINGRRMTNIGLFRKYIEQYLKNHPGIRQDMTILVRQMPVEDKGIPLEIYCFANIVTLNEYEYIQADIFDHIMAAVSFFDLEIFQQPTGTDIRNSVEKFTQTFRTLHSE